MGVIGGLMLGLGAMTTGKQQGSAAASAAKAHDAMAAAKPEVPEAPITPGAPGAEPGTSGTTDNALMEAAREKELRAAARRRAQAQEIFTSGLGAGGLAGTSKKTLLGG